MTRCSGMCTWVTPSVGNINYGRCCVEAPDCKIILKTLHPNYKLLLRPKPYTTIINLNVCYITYIYDHFHIVLTVISRYSWLFMVIHVIKPTGVNIIYSIFFILLSITKYKHIVSTILFCMICEDVTRSTA